MSMLEVQISNRGTARILQVKGELDLASVALLEDAFRELEERGDDVVVLDLRKLGFLDSTGLRAIITADGRFREQGGRLVLVRGPETVHRVFELTALDKRLEFVADPSEIGDDGPSD